MSYQRSRFVTRVRRNRFSSLDGVENCGGDQVWDPNIEYLGQKGQCMPRKNYTAAQLENPNAYPTSVKSTNSSSSSSIAGDIAKWLGGLTANAINPPQQPVYVPPASTGISTGTMIVGAGALAAVLYIALKD